MFARLTRFASLSSVALLAIAGGCSNSGSSASVPSAPGAQTVLADAKGGKGGGGKGCPSFDTKGGGGSGGGFIFTAQLYGHDLNVYKRSGSPSGSGGLQLTYDCTIKNGVMDPNGTVTTQNGWWFVANGGGENVLEYRVKKNGISGPLSSLSDYSQYPTNVSTNPSRQLVAVSNLDTAPSGGGGSLAIYLHRQSVPSRMLYPGGTVTMYGAGVAVSHTGDCYWGVNQLPYGPGMILKFTKCNGKPTVVVSGIPLVGGLALDQRNDLFYVNSATSGSYLAGVYECPKASSSNCGPFSTTGFVDPTNINFDYHGKNLWIVDAGTGIISAINVMDGSIEYNYQTTGDSPYGVAPEPGG